MADSENNRNRNHTFINIDNAKGYERQPDKKIHVLGLSETVPTTFNKAKSDMITYEDLLIHRYLENLSRERRDNPQDKQIPPSPYLQRLPHSHLTSERYRPVSAHIRSSRPSSAKPKIDAKFIADSAIWDPATPRQAQLRRPRSAPVRLLRPQSADLQRKRGSKSMYRKQQHVIKVKAFINGSRDTFIHIAAANMKILLEFATEKLGLPFAARRIFTEDGKEIFSENRISPESNIYISMGEGFKDPYYATKRNLVIKNGLVWNLNGVVLPENGHKKETKTRLSKRIRALSENKKVRIMVLKNGQSSLSCEVVTDLKNMQNFFICCAAKLEFNSCAKLAYDLDGNEITDLANTPCLDDSIIAYQGKSPLLGPLWISSGERFNPLGALSFLVMVKNVIKNKLKIAKQQMKNITFALDDEKDKVKDVAVLSLSTEELYEASQKIDDEINKYKEAMAIIKEKIDALENKVFDDKVNEVDYRFSHIKKLSINDRLVGTRGCKLKVFENGKASGSFTYYFNIREALRGVKDNINKELLQMLLDELSSTKFSEGASRNLNAVATTLYDKNGSEITDVLAIEQEQNGQIESDIEQVETSVWLSFGEPYICPFTYALHLFLDKVIVDNDTGKSKIVMEPLLPDKEHRARDFSKLDVLTEFPTHHDINTHFNVKSHFLQNKDEHDYVLYPEIGVTEKLACKNQLFVYTENGHIYSKVAPQLCLSVSDTKVETRLFSSDIPVEGFAVCMQKKSYGDRAQIWKCRSDATIYSEAYPNLLLTYLGKKRDDDSVATDEEDHFAGSTTDVSDAFLVVADSLPKKVRSAQRFAFKQENFQNLGQWKKTEYSNSEWSKQAYSWPVKTNGELNKEYDWPMEGYIIPNAPSLKKSENKLGLSGMTPVRLRVLKNFEPNENLAISVVGPNITNMMKNHIKKKQFKKKSKKDVSSQNSSEDDEFHCLDITVAEVEFQMFLQNCTNLLNLPIAARRLYDSNGQELFTIQKLERDALVYVSCGEPWAGTNVSRVEQKRRFLLSQLSSDVAKIQHYCSLRNPENFVLEVNGPLAAKSGLIVNKQWSGHAESKLNEGEGSGSKGSNDQLVSEPLEDETEDDLSLLDSGLLSAHQRAHLESEERLNSLKWPWERLVNVANSMDMNDPEASKYTDRDLYEKFKPQTTTRISRDVLQKFEFADEYISLVANPNLVLSISETEGRVVNVVLANRRLEDINQRWVIRENGEIQARHNQNMVLTVSMPTITSDEHTTLSFDGCPVTLQSRCGNTYGKAHQIWRYNAESGFIQAFHSNSYDKEITAATKADVCTYAIAQAADIDQPGYQVEIDGQKHKVCLSCARALRGKYKVERLPPNTNFHCAMGDAKKLKIRQVGSFKVLNSKVDLSTFEADVSLMYWMDMLHNLKQQTSVQTIMKEISAARSVLTVKVIAYKNGEGRLRKGEIICGSSIAGILGQCTYRLDMNSAARRIYLEDGSVVLDVDDLVKFAVENCKTEMINTILLNKKEFNDIKLDVADENEAFRQQNQQQDVGEDTSGGLRRSYSIIRHEDVDHEEMLEKTSKNVGESDLLEAQEKDNFIQNEAMETQKSWQEREKLLENIKLPPLEMILRAPIEVWISSGKPFVPPEVVESKEENLRKKRQLRAQVCLALDIEKHVLRQMKGRRLEQMNPGVYESTLSSQQPVVIEKHWQELTVEEHDKHMSIDKLQSHLGEIRANQQEEKITFAGINLDGKLYWQPNMKRVLVFPNGASTERSIYVWGNNIQEIMSSAALKLGLWKQPKILYSMDGQKIEEFDNIQRDQLLCVSTGKPFMPPSSQKANTEVKANWGRARRQYGSQATDLMVDVQKNPQVDVDPFGPPLLALPVGSSLSIK